MNALPKYCAALVTPINASGAIDADLLYLHCDWVLRNGCDGAVLFGTTGEGPSFGISERQRALDDLIAQGIASSALIVGTGCVSVEDTATLTFHAIGHGCAGTLIHPPFFFRPANDDGVVDFYTQLVRRLGTKARGIVLYHFPEATGAGLSLRAIQRLLAAFPQVFVGLKDSSGDIASTVAFIDACPKLAIYTGDDHLLWPVLEHGGYGAITATANLFPSDLRDVGEGWSTSTPAAQKAQINLVTAWQDILLEFPITQAVKEVLARRTGKDSWRFLRPPLQQLTGIETERLMSHGGSDFWAVSQVE